LKIFLDFEFMEDGKTIDPLSVGMVREDDEEYYAEFGAADLRKANPWVKEHVLPNLKSFNPEISYLIEENVEGSTTVDFWAKSKKQIKTELMNFCFMKADEQKPEFWGYFCDYDWVTLCQLWGRMVDLPSFFPQYCLDVKQEMHCKKIPKEWIEKDHPQPTTHNALDDARWIKDAALWVWSY
jgi:3' exoribonuclease, RNase T-like